MIFYFSATGNSKYAADRLSEHFPGETVSIAEAFRKEEFIYEAGEGEKIIFVFPVYFWNLPSIVGDFIEKLTLKGDTSGVCAVITCGGQLLGTDAAFRKAMKKREISVRAVYSLKMPDNCVNYFKLPNREAQIMMLRSAEKDLDEIIDSIQFNFRVSYKSGPAGRLWTTLLKPVYKSQSKTGKYRVNTKCIGCGLCRDICPVSAISMENGRPVWTKKKCVWCQGCINRCPAQAIQFGKRTEKRGRYVHPIFK